MNLKLDSLYKSYDNSAVLNNISLTLTPGVYGLLGANGAGKSTLLKVICGVTRANNGKINFNDKNIFENFDSFHDSLGFLPQDFKYYPEFTGLKFMMYIAALKGLNPKQAKVKCNELLKDVGLEVEKNKKVKNYSGGMKQRLGIAQAMINDPKILILDEPTVGLDPKERITFRNLISSFSNDKIVILSTHIVSDVEYIADEIIMLKKGSILDKGIAPELIKELDKKVWECAVTQNLVFEFTNRFIVSNQKHEPNGDILLRVVSETKPSENAINVSPSLEDLYLYYFREENNNVINNSL